MEDDKKGLKFRRQILFFAAVAVILMICNLITGGKFLKSSTIMFILAHAVFYIFVSWGMIFIFTTGMVDLSIGANVLLAGNIGAILAMEAGFGYPGLILGAVVSAALMEVLTVFISTGLKIPGWVSGLGMTLIYEAILSIYGAYRAAHFGSNVLVLDKKTLGALGQVPVMLVFLVVGYVVCYFVFNKTSIGINIAAVGGNREVSQHMGIRIMKTIMMGALIGGLFIGFAALLQESYVGKLVPASGMASLSSIFRSLAIILLAGSFTSIFDQATSVLVTGILVTAMFNFLTLIGVPSGTGQDIALGVLVIATGVISNIKNKGVVK